jgi:sugar-specific transcriptional regulator TrmB
MALTEIGFTKTQAKLYLSLLQMGAIDAQNLSKKSDVPSQVTYRTLGELQQKGLVEKTMGLPQTYRALPLPDGLSVMISTKVDEYAKAVEKSKELLEKFCKLEETVDPSDYYIDFFKGKALMAKRYEAACKNTRHTVDICTTFQRWTYLTSLVSEQVKDNLQRGIKYRIIFDKPKFDCCLEKELWPIILDPNYKIGVVNEKPKINSLIFDDRVAGFVYYPGKPVAESPMVYTNHPSLVISFHEYFEKVWGKAEEIDVKGIIEKSRE